MEARAVCVLFLLISRKFNTLFFLAMYAVCYEGGTSTG
jgi:hypothetical protein